MLVCELIATLQSLPQDAIVTYSNQAGTFTLENVNYVRQRESRKKTFNHIVDLEADY